MINVGLKFYLSALCLLSVLLLLGQNNIYKNLDLSKIKKDEIVIKLKDSGIPLSTPSDPRKFSIASAASFSESIKALPHKSGKSGSCLDGIYFIKLKEDEELIDVLTKMNTYDNVVYAEPLFFDEALVIPNDPLAQTSGGSQYYLDNIHAYDAWDISKGRSDIIIGISDTGIDFNHEDIIPKIYTNPNEILNGVDDDENGFIDDINGYDFADEDNNPQNTNSYHGNRVAGLAGAATDNEIGMAGVGYNCSISGLKIFPDGGNLAFASYEGVMYAAENNYDVINLSWGSTSTFGRFRQDIIDYAVLENDLVIIAAGGNSGVEEDFYPASYDHVLSVGWTDQNDIKARDATYSYQIDLVAPGVSITSTLNDNGYNNDSGSSFAAPLVAGAAGLVIDVYPQLNALQVMEVLRTTTDDIYNSGNNMDYFGKLGSGRLNVFKALSQDTLRSIRMTDYSVTTPYDGYLFFNDAISINAALTSYLYPIKTGKISFSSTSPFVSIGNQTLNVSYTDSMQIRNISFDNILIASNAPPETRIPIRVTMEDGDYEDFQYLILETSPDYVNMDNGALELTVAGNGSLAYPTNSFNEGIGLRWQDESSLASLSLIIGNDPDSVSDNAPVQFGSLMRDGDFVSDEYIKFYETENAEHFSRSSFSDSGNDASLGLKIEQKAFAFDEPTLQDFIIIEYRITNLEADSIKNLSIGMLADWELGNGDSNSALLDKQTGIAYSFATGTEQFAGMKWMGISQPISQSLDLQSNNTNTTDIDQVLTDAIKHQLISENQFDSAGFSTTEGNDVAQVIAIPSLRLAPYDSYKGAIILSLATSIEALRSNMALAEQQYEDILNNPEVSESLISCNGALLEIDPQSGTNFRFFKDPLGEQQISEGAVLLTGAINSDTSFYFQNIDSLYANDIQKIQISLVEKVAQFEQSVDTLYLDHPTVNFVSFRDNSYEPISWKWDFGNGGRASTQHPTINFNAPGVFTVSLEVETEQGCFDTDSKQIIVANRPSLPDIDDLSICPGELFVIEDFNNDSIEIYQSLDARQILFKGLSTALTFDNDTSIFIARIENGFKSKRKEVKIAIALPETDFGIVPNTNATTSEILLLSNSKDPQTYEWFIDGEFLGAGDSLSYAIEKNSYEIKLITTSSQGCKDSLTQIFTFGPSALPSVTFEQPCLGNSIQIRPANGSAFAFYRDANTTDLISKGSAIWLEDIASDTAIYIVGLDNILPSEVVKADIKPIRFDFEIEANPNILDLSESKNVIFKTNADDQINWDWYLNGMQISSLKELQLFFNTAGNQQIVCNGYNSSGCLFSDTLNYEVVDKIELPLSTSENPLFSIYPNPSRGKFTVAHILENSKVTVTHISGKIVYTANIVGDHHSIELPNIQSGMYLVTIVSLNKTETKSVIIR